MGNLDRITKNGMGIPDPCSRFVMITTRSFFHIGVAKEIGIGGTNIESVIVVDMCVSCLVIV